MSPITSTPASRAAKTLQCGAGGVSGAPGVRISAAKFAHDTFRRSAVMKPACAALAILSALSSPAITSAPPAFSAWQLARPEPPRPNTATVLPAKDVTGVMRASPKWRPHSEERAFARVSKDGLHALLVSILRDAPLRGAPQDEAVSCGTAYSSGRSSPQFQRREAGQRQHHGDDPAPDHDLRLRPPFL